MAAIAVAGVGLMMVCCSSSVAALMMGGSEETPAAPVAAGAGADTGSDDEDAAPDPYRIEAGIDYPGSDLFHYWPGGAIKATKDVCLDKCTDLPTCKLVTFNNAETLCWGKSAANNKKTHDDRNNYFKN